MHGIDLAFFSLMVLTKSWSCWLVSSANSNSLRFSATSCNYFFSNSLTLLDQCGPLSLNSLTVAVLRNGIPKDSYDFLPRWVFKVHHLIMAGRTEYPGTLPWSTAAVRIRASTSLQSKDLSRRKDVDTITLEKVGISRKRTEEDWRGCRKAGEVVLISLSAK